MARSGVTFESKIEAAKEKIRENPQAALREIGKLIVPEVRKEAAKSKETRVYYLNGKKVTVKPGRLKRSIGYWYRKKERDLQIGSKSFYAKWEEFGSSKNHKRPFLMPAIKKNLELIKGLIADSLRELNRE